MRAHGEAGELDESGRVYVLLQNVPEFLVKGANGVDQMCFEGPSWPVVAFLCFDKHSLCQSHHVILQLWGGGHVERLQQRAGRVFLSDAVPGLEQVDEGNDNAVKSRGPCELGFGCTDTARVSVRDVVFGVLVVRNICLVENV